MKKVIIPIIFLCISMITFAGCSLLSDIIGGGSGETGSTEPGGSAGDSGGGSPGGSDGDFMIGIRGTITNIERSSGKEAIIMVEGKIEEDTVYDKASVHINTDTMIQKDNLSRLFSISDLRVGDIVEVIFTGPVAESYPVQGTAEIVRIITQK